MTVVRLVVAQPARTRPDLDVVRALERIDDVELTLVPDAGPCLAACAGGDVDLVVASLDPSVGWGRILDALRDAGPPVVLTGPGLDADAAVTLFRRGAADVVATGPGQRDALAAAVREQLQRRRSAQRRERVERRIRDLERYAENIIQNMNSALLVVDREGCVTAANPPAEAILGEPASALRGRPVWTWFPKAGAEGDYLARSLEAGARFRGAESVLRRGDGRAVPVGISCAPLQDEAGRPIGAVATFQDLSEMKELQSQLLQSAKMASIGQLAAGVAHEVNNPMGFIHANLFQMAEYVADLRGVWKQVEALQETLGGDAETRRRAGEALAAAAEAADVRFLLADLDKAIRESQEGSERIRHIVHDLRDFSHHDTGDRVLADLGQCLDSTATIVWPMMKHLVTLERDYRDVPQVPCFPMQLKQVFMNLLVNAYQAIEERVGESGELGSIRLTTGSRAGWVTVSVSDTGCGIPAERLERIFEPFFTTKSIGDGTGLGLSTSYGIVERHGGRMTVESVVGEGTTFRVSLPVADA